MPDINRSLVVVKPKQPFLEWLNSLEEDDVDLTLEELQYDSSTYLVPEFETDDEQMEILEWCYSYIFENELMAWYTYEPEWPDNRDLKKFLEWFEVEFHSNVTDLVTDEPLEHVEELDDDEMGFGVDPSSNGH
jgi:hypothetical protein